MIGLKILCDGVPIRLRFDGNDKRSMLFVGSSRMGKTFFASNLAKDLMQQGYLIQLVDLDDKWNVSDKECLISAGAITKQVKSQGIVLRFPSLNELIGCAKHIVSALGFRSVGASVTLKSIFQKLLDGERKGFSIKDVLKTLKDEGEEETDKGKWGEEMFERLDGDGMIPDICFCIDADKEFASESTLWELSGLADVYIRIVSYLIIYCLLCQQKRSFQNAKKGKAIFTIVDEFQNLDSDRKSVIGTCLTEGQKYGLNMILITQFLNGSFSEAVVSQLKQGGFRFYFRLTEEEAMVVSRQLVYDSQLQKEIYRKLITLPRGHCLMMGPHSVGNREGISEAFRFVEVRTSTVTNTKQLGEMRGMVFKR